MAQKGFLGLNPVKFNSVGYIGNRGHDWRAIDFNFSKLITQNLLFAAYHEPKTISEIADLLGMNEYSVWEEILYLETNGFMDRVTNTTFLTNILIHDFSKDVCEKIHNIYTKYAAKVSEKYIPQLFETCRDAFMLYTSISSSDTTERMNAFPSDKIYIPQNDLNFFKWSIATFAMSHKLVRSDKKDELKEHFEKRYGGSDGIVVVSLAKENDLSCNEKKYRVFDEIISSTMSEDGFPLAFWQYNTCHDSRAVDWCRELQSEHAYYVYKYIKNGKVGDHCTTAQELEAMLENGFLIAPNSNVNVIISMLTKNELLEMLPSITDDFLELGNQLADELYEASKSSYPEHMQKVCYAYYQNALNSGDLIVRVLEQLLKKGVLKPLTETQKKTVNMIMFSDVLPN